MKSELKSQPSNSPSHRVVESWLSSYLRGLRLFLIIAVIAIAIIALMAAIAFLMPLPRSWTDMRPAIFFALVIFSFVTSLAVLLFRARFKGQALTKNRDRAWSGLASESVRYNRFGRRYHGLFAGRKFDAYVTSVREAHGTVTGGIYAGEHVEIVLDTSLKARLRAGLSDENLRYFSDRLKGDLTRLDTAGAKGLTVFSFDADWGARALQDEKSAKLMSDLLHPKGQMEIRGLSIWPGGAMLTLRRLDPEELTPENIRTWMTLLAEWLDRLESLPPPERSAPDSKWYACLRGDRSRIRKLAYIIVFLFLFFITLLILGILWFLLRF
jgi:hypothetical protein